jgi:hypothetical protein
MMLIDTLREASTAMASSASAMNDENAIEQYKQQLIRLNSTITQLKSLIDVILAIQAQGISNTVLSTTEKEALDTSIETCGEKTHSVKLDSSDVSALKNATDLCHASAEHVWKEKSGIRAENVYASLNTLRALMPAGQEVDSLLTAIALGKGKLPTSGRSVSSFVDSIKKAQDLVEGLHLDPEIEAFIGKVKTQTATIADLDDHILSWIKTNHLTGKLKIKF